MMVGVWAHQQDDMLSESPRPQVGASVIGNFNMGTKSPPPLTIHLRPQVGAFWDLK